ncbi:MAG: hypothetical protein Unbinned3459contig1000_46 [Prokaryotic dsDNA virus sp.]|jgi:hypothetical protein|nr:MAG: hypothetical protein Unbinned3459contig1000_46 [Prokaryotic dsDNA virus sp.]
MHKTVTSLEDALDLIYRGQTNVAVKAKEIGISLEEMKRLFNQYVSERQIDPDVWQADVELSWPWS